MPVTTLDPRTALVVVDLQNGVTAAPVVPHSSADVVARTARLADAFRDHDLPVVLVRVTQAADGADALPGRTEMPRPGRTRPDGWDTVLDELSGHASDLVVETHENSVARIFPKLGETGTTADVLALLTSPSR